MMNSPSPFADSPKGLSRYFTKEWWNGTSLWWRLMAITSMLTGLAIATPSLSGWVHIGMVSLTFGLAILAARTHVWRHQNQGTPLEYNSRKAAMLLAVSFCLSIFVEAFVKSLGGTSLPAWSVYLLVATPKALVFFFMAVLAKNEIVGVTVRNIGKATPLYFTRAWWRGASLWWYAMTVGSVLTGLAIATPDLSNWVRFGLAALTFVLVFPTAKAHVWSHQNRGTPLLDDNSWEAEAFWFCLAGTLFTFVLLGQSANASMPVWSLYLVSSLPWVGICFFSAQILMKERIKMLMKGL